MCGRQHNDYTSILLLSVLFQPSHALSTEVCYLRNTGVSIKLVLALELWCRSRRTELSYSVVERYDQMKYQCIMSTMPLWQSNTNLNLANIPFNIQKHANP